MKEQLWSELKAGNEQAFMQVYKQTYQALYGFGCRVHNNRQVVKDAIHEMFCEIWDSRTKLPQVENVTAYLFTYLKRKLLKEITIEVKHNNFVQEDSGKQRAELSWEEMLVQMETDAEMKEKLHFFLQKLTPAQLQIVRLKFYDGLSYEQIAKKLSLQPRTVYNKVYESLQLLRKYLNIIVLLGITMP